MEYLHPYRMGYKPLFYKDAIDLPSWENVMFELSGYTVSSEKSLDDILKDDRVGTLRSVRIWSELLPKLIEHRDLIPHFDSVFLENSTRDKRSPEERDPTILLNAFPGLRKCYIKEGMEHPEEPLRHIGLDYLGLPIYSVKMKRLHDLVLPNLRTLAINFCHIDDIPNPETDSDDDQQRIELVQTHIHDLIDVMAGRIFPQLERLHINGCNFIDQFCEAAFIKSSSPVTIKNLDIMTSGQAIGIRKYALINLENLSESENLAGVKITLDDQIENVHSKKLGEQLRQGVDLLPY